MQRLETKAECIDSTYSMTFLTVRITKHWSSTLQKSKYRISHVKREKISLNPSFVLKHLFRTWDCDIYLYQNMHCP